MRAQEARSQQLLANDSLASFLREIDDADDLFAPPLSSRHVGDSPSSLLTVVWPSTSEQVMASRAKKPVHGGKLVPTRNTKAQHDGRVKKLREEIHELYQELKRLQQTPAESAKDSNRVNWKRRAACERFARDRAEYANAYLKQRLSKSAKLREEVRRLLLRQQEQLPSKAVKVQLTLVDDDTRAFGLLRADLMRRQYQLEASMQSRLLEIAHLSRLGCVSPPSDNWGVAVQDQSLRMDIGGSILLPFKAALINAVICQYTQSGTIQVAGDNVVDRVVRDVAANDVDLRFALDRVSGGRELEGRSILRRIRNEYGTILVWESMSSWQRTDASGNSPHAIVRESGWSIVAPAEDDPEAMSIGYCGKSFRISSSDGSRLDQSDPLVRKIVHTCQEFYNFHSRRMESMTIDLNLLQQKELAALASAERVDANFSTSED